MSVTDVTMQLTELYKIVLTGNYAATAYFTNHDENIVYGGATYQSIPITRSAIGYNSNLQIDKVDVSFGLVGVRIGDVSMSIPQLIKGDFLKYAHIYIYLYDVANSALVSCIFEGFLTGDVSFNQGIVVCSFSSILDKLRQKFPYMIYSEFCNHNLFDTYCGLKKSDYKATGAVLADSTKGLIYADVFEFAVHGEGYWEKGEIIFTSGQNINISRNIKKHIAGGIYVLTPFPFTPAVGNTFDVYPGCDKSGVTCDEKFSNYANFFGFETIPKPEIMYG